MTLLYSLAAELQPLPQMRETTLLCKSGLLTFKITGLKIKSLHGATKVLFWVMTITPSNLKKVSPVQSL